MTTIKETIKSFLPTSVVQMLQRNRARVRLKRRLRPFAKLSPSQVFTQIYERGLWGSAPEGAQKFFSGPGSHESRAVDCYVDAVQRFLTSLEIKPDVVDLGCGDFFVGSQIRPFCEGYIACDVVESLIVYNKTKFNSLNVEFKVLDLTRDPIPQCHVLFLRQVLQHISNKHIERALPKLSSCCKYLVLTEHLPPGDPFTPNVDIGVGPAVRPELNSGVVLSSPPFNLKAMEERTLCEISMDDGRIRTTLFRLGEHSQNKRFFLSRP